MTTVYIALGSNLGNRVENLARARVALNGEGIRILRESSIYETEPRDLLDQPMFLNQVLEAETDLEAGGLLMRVLDIENALGRERTIAMGPRIIDIDILLMGEVLVSSADLEIPHPRMGERRFVLEPLAELAAELVHPVTNLRVRDMLSRVRDQQARRFLGGV